MILKFTFVQLSIAVSEIFVFARDPMLKSSWFVKLRKDLALVGLSLLGSRISIGWIWFFLGFGDVIGIFSIFSDSDINSVVPNEAAFVLTSDRAIGAIWFFFGLGLATDDVTMSGVFDVSTFCFSETSWDNIFSSSTIAWSSVAWIFDSTGFSWSSFEATSSLSLVSSTTSVIVSGLASPTIDSS